MSVNTMNNSAGGHDALRRQIQREMEVDLRSAELEDLWQRRSERAREKYIDRLLHGEAMRQSVEAIIAGDAELVTAWNRLLPSHQREILAYIATPRTAAGRRRHLKRAKRIIAIDGHGL